VNVVEIIKVNDLRVDSAKVFKARMLGPSVETIEAARAVVGPDADNIAFLETALNEWREATAENLPRLAMMAKIACSIAGREPSADTKRDRECPAGAACPCRNPECDLGWITEEATTGHPVAHRCDECPPLVRDAPVDPWA
jgi:hypothetical protein